MVTIPTRFSSLLNGLTDEISAAVGSTLSKVDPILVRNEAQFFTDYTDHGTHHIDSVLRTCELILSDTSWSVFTREDVATLVLATLAHDIGMLIDIGGFQYIVNTNQSDKFPIISPNDEPWHKLWRDFQLDARRFDGTTLINIVGSPEPVAINELDPDHLTERGMKIVGEFLRRHHHRLAHEIVINGMPTGNGRVALFDGVPNQLREVAGRVARSHGVPIRDCIESFVKIDRTGHREYRHIHPTFIMTLVRIADYLDLDIDRAPASILAAKVLRSPISRREWWSHRAIVDCHSLDEDPECLHVVVDPAALPDISTFVVVEDKITGIQRELDSCWAVLGEVYGRFPPLNQLSIKIRRIRSDIREWSTIQDLPYVPFKASLESARADLLKLLIEPLYGDHPGIGIRELIQNAIDAVRELDFVIKSTHSSITIEQEELEGDVVVNIIKNEQGEYWVTISDRGIGMTWESVSKYYLTAGASFRQSDVWKKRFTDDSGNAKVLRSGRFGIGVLAAFLLGDRIHVSTRHYEVPEDHGIQFEFGLDDTSIEMRWLKRKVGTTIKVRTNEAIVNRLMSNDHWKGENWDWYCLEKPTLVRKDINGKKITPKFLLPGSDGTLPNNWHRITVPGLQAVDWTYKDKVPNLTCNGILIPDGNINLDNEFYQSKSNYNERTFLTLYSPKVSVYDPDGRFPLNLARDKVASKLDQLESLLADDVCRNFLAYCLINGPKEHLVSGNNLLLYSRTKYPGVRYYEPYYGFLFDTPYGFGLCDPWNISCFAFKTGLLFRINGSDLKLSQLMTDLVMKTYGFVFGVSTSGHLYAHDSWNRNLALTCTGSLEGLKIFKGIKVRGLRTIMPIDLYKRFIKQHPKFVVRQHNVESKLPEWVTVTFGECPSTGSMLIELANDLKSNHISIENATECFLTDMNDSPKPGRIAQMWKDVIGGPIIPFDEAERQRIVSKLSDQYKDHIEEWRFSELKRGTRKQ
jgi:hypothetical protein